MSRLLAVVVLVPVALLCILVLAFTELREDAGDFGLEVES